MKKLALLIGFMTLLASGTAFAVPKTMSFTGRLSTSTGPVTGSVNLTFKLYSVATGGTETWTEVRNGVGADNGLVFVDLGEVTPLDPMDFIGPKMYLEITVGTEVLAPRLAINSVPYALHSENSDTLGGLVTAADVVTDVTGTNGIAAAKSGNTISVALSTAGCSAGQVYKYNGTSFACAADADSAPVAGAGIAVSGNTVSLSTTGCTAAGYVWKWNGTAWACSPDADSTPVAGAGIAVSGNTVSLSTSGCLAGYVWKWNGTTWACSADANNTYTAGSGLSLSGNTFSITTGGITAAMIATNGVGMDEISVPIGNHDASLLVSNGVGTYIYPTGTVVPMATSGTCYVTAYVEVAPGAMPTGYAYLYVGVHNATTNLNVSYLPSSSLAPNAGGIYYSALSSRAVGVLAGNAYTFGCEIRSANGSFLSKTYTCYTTYICI